MATVPRPTYPTVDITPGAGDDSGGGGGGDGLDESAVKALIAMQRAARDVDADFALGADDGFVAGAPGVGESITGTLPSASSSSIGRGRMYIVANRGAGDIHLTAAAGNVLGPTGAPLSPPGYTVSPESLIIITATASSSPGWQVVHHSALYDLGGSDPLPWSFSHEFAVPADDFLDAETGFKISLDVPLPGSVAVSLHDLGVVGDPDKVYCHVYDRTDDVVLSDWAAFAQSGRGVFFGSAEVGHDLTITVLGPWAEEG